MEPRAIWIAIGFGAILVAAVAGAGPPAADSPPVLLRSGLLLTPVEAAGSGVAPEVKVRVSVDAAGRVAKVEVLKIEPSTSFDEVFRRATVENLRQWRYAPARSDGEPVATTLEWTVQFLAKEAPEAGGLADSPIVADDDLGAARRARVSALTREERVAILDRYIKAAEKHLDAGQRRRADSARFVVVSDAPDAKTAEIVAGNLEAAFNVLDRLFRPAIEPQPEPYKVVAFVYWHQASFDAVEHELGGPPGGPAGFYLPPGFLAFHLELPTAESPLHILLHESFHAYADRHLARPGFSLPLWLDEGLAEYLANSEIKKGELIPGRVLRGKFVFSHSGGAARQRTAAAYSLDDVRHAIRSGEAPTLAQVMKADRTVFYGEKRDLLYPMAWLLVHFLRHARPEWSEGSFPALVLYLAEGYPTDDALRATYDASPAELEVAFRAYAKGL